MRSNVLYGLSLLTGFLLIGWLAIGAPTDITGPDRADRGELLELVVVTDSREPVGPGDGFQAWSVEVYENAILVCVENQDGQRGYAQVGGMTQRSVELRPGTFEPEDCEVDWTIDNGAVWKGPGHVFFTAQGRPRPAGSQI